MKQYYLFLLLSSFASVSQISIPYSNNFDSPTSDEGWTHYAISGTDNWGRGIPTGVNPLTGNRAWETNLMATPSTNSNMALETPAFDLTNVNGPYVLSFKYKSSINSAGLYLEYTLNNGATWQLFNPATTLKKNWQSAGGFSTTMSSFATAAINISSLSGNSSVKFRFRFLTYSYCNGYGWVIDDFSINTEQYNVYASSAEPIEVSPLCPELNVKTSLNFDNQYNAFYTLYTKYYLSTDMTLDASDTYLGEKGATVSTTITTWNHLLNTPAGLVPGQYYIVFHHDANNVVTENNEADNIGYAALVVKPIFQTPYSTDFEADDANWKFGQNINSTTEMLWERGLGRLHHIEKSHSGNAAWHTSKTVIDEPEGTLQWVESPYFNLSSATSLLYINFWFKTDYPNGIDPSNQAYKVQYVLNCGAYWQDLHTIPINTSDEWEFVNIQLPAAIASSSNVKFRITYDANYQHAEGLIFDDFYIGADKPDLTIEKIYSNRRFTSSTQSADVLKYTLANSGLATISSSVIRFHWSANNTLDASDTVLGEQTVTGIATGQQWLTFNYTKPTTAPGDYFIIYTIDPQNQVDEYREGNNIGAIPVEQSPRLPFPYYNDFETNSLHWKHEATLGVDEWEYSEPQGVSLNQAFSGTKAWISKPSGAVSSLSRMHLYTPAFDLTTSENPVLEFDMKLDAVGGCSCFQLTMNMSYSTDNGATWTVLKAENDSYSKWYHSMKYYENTGLDDNYGINYTRRMFDYSELTFSTVNQYNSRDTWRNTHYAVNIEHLKDESNIRFRFNLSTEDNMDPMLFDMNEGALIDNFSIGEAWVDLDVNYTKNLVLSSLATKVNFDIDIRNTGNQISADSNIKFYLSANTTYDAADLLLSTSVLTPIRPDFKRYLSVESALPVNLSDYAYLVYVIDPENLIVEADESNNSGYFTLGLSGVTTFPYTEDFEGDVINGWHGYSYNWSNTTTLDNYRVTNKLPVAFEPNLYRREYHGVFRMEKVAYGNWQAYMTPAVYIQSPAFDFTTYASSEPLTMAFDFMGLGQVSQNGGNMQYSTDGGQTWTVLLNTSGPSENFYPSYQTLTSLGGQPGWYGNTGEIKTAKMNISFLQNQPNVLFRYKYVSNYAVNGDAPRGFRLDNFVIGTPEEANEFSCIETIPYLMTFDNIDETCWEINDNDDAAILLDRSEDGNIQWESVSNFGSLPNNPSVKIDLHSQGNTNGVWLVSPKFSMLPDTALRISVALTEMGGNAAAVMDEDDTVKLFISTDNGLNWGLLKTWTSITPILNGGQIFNIDDFIPENKNTRIAFWASNGLINSGSDTSFYVDNIEFYSTNLNVHDNPLTSLEYYPNPVTGLLHLKTDGSVLTRVRIASLTGQILSDMETHAYSYDMDMSGYATGLYLVSVFSDEKVRHLRIVKK